MPVGLEDTSKFPNLLEALIIAGWSDNDIRKIAGENLIRVFEEVEQVKSNQNHKRESVSCNLISFYRWDILWQKSSQRLTGFQWKILASKIVLWLAKKVTYSEVVTLDGRERHSAFK